MSYITLGDYNVKKDNSVGVNLFVSVKQTLSEENVECQTTVAMSLLENTRPLTLYIVKSVYPNTGLLLGVQQ